MTRADFHPFRDRWRQLLAAWLVAFPAITLLLALLQQAMESWPLVARTLVLVTLMVPIMNIATPIVLSLLGRSGARATSQTSASRQS